MKFWSAVKYIEFQNYFFLLYTSTRLNTISNYAELVSIVSFSLVFSSEQVSDEVLFLYFDESELGATPEELFDSLFSSEELGLRFPVPCNSTSWATIEAVDNWDEKRNKPLLFSCAWGTKKLSLVLSY